MKTNLILLILIYSGQLFSQPSKKDKATMFATIAILTAPTILVFANAGKEDKHGKIIFGTFAAMSIASGVTSLCFSEKKKTLHYSLFFLAGAMDGFNEELTHHYWKVKDKIPGLNDQWFDPSISWNNKYTSNVPFAKTLLVGTTDAYHATRSLNKLFVIGGIFTFEKPKSFKQGVKKVLLISTFYSLGKGGVHYLINK